MNMSNKELAKEDEDFKREYLATKESILTMSLTIVAIATLLITLILISE
ncbi:hypothetical protein ACXYMT_04230 [Salinimicrobium sp. CAU 1759]